MHAVVDAVLPDYAFGTGNAEPAVAAAVTDLMANWRLGYHLLAADKFCVANPLPQEYA